MQASASSAAAQAKARVKVKVRARNSWLLDTRVSSGVLSAPLPLLAQEDPQNKVTLSYTLVSCVLFVYHLVRVHLCIPLYILCVYIPWPAAGSFAPARRRARRPSSSPAAQTPPRPATAPAAPPASAPAPKHHPEHKSEHESEHKSEHRSELTPLAGEFTRKAKKREKERDAASGRIGRGGGDGRPRCPQGRPLSSLSGFSSAWPRLCLHKASVVYNLDTFAS
eukprot:1179843-Prorocentrum_minimum.AAC.1